MKAGIVAAAMMVAVAAHAATGPKASDKYFYVYNDKGSQMNHFIPSGWMGDYGDLKMNDADATDPADGRTAIKITYNAKAAQGANWSGIYWQTPANNWGNVPGGFDLTGFKKLTFWIRGEKGGEVINEIKMGGIVGEKSADTDAASIGPVTLEKGWKKYEIDLTGKTLTNVLGGFCWATSKDNNPEGFTMYLDEIRYER